MLGVGRFGEFQVHTEAVPEVVPKGKEAILSFP